MSEKERDLTEEELEQTAGGRKLRRVDSDAAPAGGSIELGADESEGGPTVTGSTELTNPPFPTMP